MHRVSALDNPNPDPTKLLHIHNIVIWHALYRSCLQPPKASGEESEAVEVPEPHPAVRFWQR